MNHTQAYGASLVSGLHRENKAHEWLSGHFLSVIEINKYLSNWVTSTIIRVAEQENAILGKQSEQ